MIHRQNSILMIIDEEKPQCDFGLLVTLSKIMMTPSETNRIEDRELKVYLIE